VIDKYLHEFSSLRQDRSGDYPSETLRASPHKPLLLLAVLDRFTESGFSSGKVPLDPALGDLFSDYWRTVMPRDSHPNIALPFYHLSSESFWHLVPAEGSENVIESGRRLRSIRELHDHTDGARLDDDLADLMQDEEAVELLRRTLIETYFDKKVYLGLYEQGRVHEEAFKYSRALLDYSRSNGKTRLDEPDSPVRDKGFRRAIVDAYGHRCAVSGLRIQTSDGLSAVDAAHIVPWSESYNDDPRNGICLSKLCHWVFEQGLITITEDYTVALSPELTASYNIPGHLATLSRRSIFLPEDEVLYPSAEYIRWHHSNCFRS